MTTTRLDGRTEHGIWSECMGGFVDSQIYTDGQAAAELAALYAAGEDPEDLKVLAFCQDHRDAEQPADGCEDCAAAEAEAEADNDDEED